MTSSGASDSLSTYQTFSLKVTHDSLRTSIFWLQSESTMIFVRQLLTTLGPFSFFFFFFLKPGLFHFLGTLLVLPESMSLELKFLKHQIKSFVCSFLHGYHYYYSGLTSIWSETVLKEPFACAFWVQQNLLTLKDAGRKSQCRKG